LARRTWKPTNTVASTTMALSREMTRICHLDRTQSVFVPMTILGVYFCAPQSRDSVSPARRQTPSIF
jgi:hypothetical protein